MQALHALGVPAGDEVADAIGLGLALGAPLVIVGLMKARPPEQALADLASFVAGDLTGGQGYGCNRIIGELALCPVDQLGQQKAAHAALGRKDRSEERRVGKASSSSCWARHSRR